MNIGSKTHGNCKYYTNTHTDFLLLLPKVIFKGHAKFQLESRENKDTIFPSPKFTDPSSTYSNIQLLNNQTSKSHNLESSGKKIYFLPLSIGHGLHL